MDELPGDFIQEEIVEQNITVIGENECGVCGGTLAMIREPVTVLVGERFVAVEFEHRKCASCGATFHRPGETRALRQAAATILRHEEGLLGPDEVKHVRESLGITQDKFDRLINAGPKTSARWETGMVAQSGAADTLIRILRDVPEAVSYLSQVRGIPASRLAPAVRVSSRSGG